MLGTLDTVVAGQRPDLLAPAVAAALLAWPAAAPVAADDILVAPINPDVADTAAFCAEYEVALEVSANCVVVAGKRAGETRYAACVVLATTRADINGVVRRHLDVRKASFLPMAQAVEVTGMEYGGITAIGLPSGWPILVDAAIVEKPAVVIGSGVRSSKIVLPGSALAALPNAVVFTGLGLPSGEDQ